MGHDNMESLLSAHYGYDVGDARDKMQVLSETQKWLGKEILHVARMKSLLIGPGEFCCACTRTPKLTPEPRGPIDMG